MDGRRIDFERLRARWECFARLSCYEPRETFIRRLIRRAAYAALRPVRYMRRAWCASFPVCNLEFQLPRRREGSFSRTVGRSCERRVSNHFVEIVFRYAPLSVDLGQARAPGDEARPDQKRRISGSGTPSDARVHSYQLALICSSWPNP